MLTTSCSTEVDSASQVQSDDAKPAQTYAAVESLMPADKLTKVKAALPKVAFPALQAILTSDKTIWYDHDSMTPAYQDSVGANSNANWPDLVAADAGTINGLHDRTKKRWQFPFATTAGTDAATAVKVVNFIALPEKDGQLLSIPIWTATRTDSRVQWLWIYPVGTVLGELIFVTNGGELLPSEIRTRTRYQESWATNVFRPFVTAKGLAAAIKQRRGDWQSKPNLDRMVRHLENDATLKPKSLAEKAALANTFKQDGALDTLPDFEDPALVKELLTQTTFISSYGEVWKASAGLKTYAAASDRGVSIVPTNYEAGLIEVNEQSCMRCHKETGRMVREYYGALYLYGELWGKDGIFSFHPFDESRFSSLRQSGGGIDGYVDNRRVNPRLKAMGVFTDFDASKHTAPLYPKRVSPGTSGPN